MTKRNFGECSIFCGCLIKIRFFCLATAFKEHLSLGGRLVRHNDIRKKLQKSRSTCFNESKKRSKRQSYNENPDDAAAVATT